MDVVGPIVINQPNTLDGIALAIEFAEDIEQVVGNSFVAHHLAYMFMALGIDVRQTEIAQFRTGHGTTFGIGVAAHTLKDGIRYSLRREGLGDRGVKNEK